MVPVVPLFSTQHVKGNTGSFSRIKTVQRSNGQNLGWKFEVIGRSGRVEKMYDHAEPTKVKRL